MLIIVWRLTQEPQQTYFTHQVTRHNYNAKYYHFRLHYKHQYTEGLKNCFIINDKLSILKIIHFICVVLLGWLIFILKGYIKLQLSHIISKINDENSAV